MPIPNIVLKDKTGVPVEYEGIARIDVLSHDVDGNSEIAHFSRLQWMKCYAFTADGNGNMLITGQISSLGGSNIFMFGFDDADMEKMGKPQADGRQTLQCFLSLRNLTVGETYKSSDIIYGEGM